MKYWDKAWSLVDGCTPVSEGCEHCWACQIAYRFRKEENYLPSGDCGIPNLTSYDRPEWTGEIILMDRLNIPLKTRKPTVFSVWNDLFHESVPESFILEAFSTMVVCLHHTFLVLTKRAKRMKEVMENINIAYPESVRTNIYLGITAENQQRLEERLPYLLQIPGKRFISYEPALGEIDLNRCIDISTEENQGEVVPYTDIHQVIAGAETGHHARPANLDWFRSLRDQCHEAGIPFFLKQINSKRERVLDGREHNELTWR